MKHYKMKEIDGVGWLAPDRVRFSDIVLVVVSCGAFAGILAYAILASWR